MMTTAFRYHPPNPSWRDLLRYPEHLVAFGFGSGLAPKAPGTFGTLAAVPLTLPLLWLDTLGYGVVLCALFGAGCWICGRSTRRLGVHDHPGIVFDEFVGLMVAAWPLVWLQQPAWPGMAYAVVAFRVLDIAKPWPIGWLDRRVHGGVGIMLDDALAGVAAAAVVVLVLRLSGAT